MRDTISKCLETSPIKFSFKFFEWVSKQNFVLDQEVKIKIAQLLIDFICTDLFSYVLNVEILLVNILNFIFLDLRRCQDLFGGIGRRLLSQISIFYVSSIIVVLLIQNLKPQFVQILFSILSILHFIFQLLILRCCFRNKFSRRYFLIPLSHHKSGLHTSSRWLISLL